MKRVLLALLGIILISEISMAQARLGNFTQRGNASQDMQTDGLTAAHASLPIGSKVRVTNLSNNKEIEVTVTGRIPSSSDRIVDLSPGAALALDIGFGGPVLLSIASPPRPRPLPPPEVAAAPDPEPEPEPEPEPPVIAVVPEPEPEPEPVPEPPTLERIAVTTPPDKTAYQIGEDLELAGLVVTGTWSDGSREVIPRELLEVSGFSSALPGTATVNLEYSGKETAFFLPVLAPPPPVIAVAEPEPEPLPPPPPPPPAPAPAPLPVVVPPPPRKPKQPVHITIYNYVTAEDSELEPEPEPVRQQVEGEKPSSDVDLNYLAWLALMAMDAREAREAREIREAREERERREARAAPAPATAFSVEIPPPAAVTTTFAPAPPPPQPQPVPGVSNVWVIPGIPNPNNNRFYQLQVGAYSSYESASHAYQLVRAAGFDAALEQVGNVYRVYAAGVPAQTVQYALQRLGVMGFSQVWIRE